MKVHNLVVTGSLQSGTENIGSISSSVAAVTLTQGTKLTAIETATSSLNSKTGSYATTGSNTFIGNQTVQGSIIPSANGAYDLGDPTHVFRHLYLSSGSLYIDGTKVLGSTTQELQITTDSGQSFKILEAGSDTITLQSADGNITFASSGGGDVILDPTSGIIALKGTTTIYAGNKVLSSDGNAIQFGNSVTMTGSLIVTGYVETQELRTTYISSSILYRSGSTKFGDELTDTHAFTGSVLISGSISIPGSNIVSGSAQVISLLPSGTISGSVQILNGSGVWSGSAQLPSGIVSGSAQVDVMSTTNIARLATTGSNIFTSNQIVSGAFTTTGNLYAGTLGSSDRGLYVGSNGNEASFLYNATTGNLDISPRSGYSVLVKGATTFGTSGGTGIYNTYANLYVGKGLQIQGNYSAISGVTDTGIFGTDSSFSDGYGGLIVASRIDASRPIIFATHNGTSFGERVRIAGAGSMTLNSTLVVNSGYTTATAITVNSATSGDTPVINISRGSGSHKGSGLYIGSANYTDVNDQAFIELSAGSYSGSQTRYIVCRDNSGTDFVVRGDGRVGVGVASPGDKFEVADGGIRITETGVSSFTTSYSSGRVQFGMDSAGTDGFYFRTYNSGYADRFSVRSNGRVMVGAGTPYGILHVEGSHVGGYGIVNIVSTDNCVLALDSTGTQDVRFRIKYGGTDKWFTGIYLSDNYDIRSSDNTLKISIPQSGSITFGATLLPTSDTSYNLGSTSYRWGNIYTTDLHLSNEGSQNSVDGTWGDWTLQEGENDIFMLNNRSGEKFKIKLEKII